jgi:hypothetical protein
MHDGEPQVAIPEFAMGAMENWGLVTYREVDLLIDERKASSQQKQRVATVVAHELAHQCECAVADAVAGARLPACLPAGLCVCRVA